MTGDDAAEKNRAAWNAAAAQHRAARWETVLSQLTEDVPGPFDRPALDLFEQVDFRGRSVCQLCCNNGRELLWLKRHGAGDCVGVDIADENIAQAKELSAVTGLDATFERHDVMTLGREFDGRFDIVLTTIGVFNWHADIAAFFDIVARLLKPGGHYLVSEFHPILWMMEPDRGEDFVHSYFDDRPWRDSDPIDYYDGTSGYAAPEKVEFQHTLGNIIQSVIDAGLRLVSVREYPVDTMGDFAHLEDQPAQLPLSYNLIAVKPK